MDEADSAAMQIEMNEARSIKYASIEAKKPIPTSEFCLWCGSKTKDGRRWCNSDCRNMFEEFGGQ